MFNQKIYWHSFKAGSEASCTQDLSISVIQLILNITASLAVSVVAPLTTKCESLKSHKLDLKTSTVNTIVLLTYVCTTYLIIYFDQFSCHKLIM